MKDTDILSLTTDDRHRLWQKLYESIETYISNVSEGPVTPELNPEKLRDILSKITFEQATDPVETIDFITKGLSQYQTHTPHPRYFGLFNPAPTTMGIAADAIVAAFNPQLAAWSHSPLAIEIEHHLVRLLAGRFGFNPAEVDGTFTSGGAEANHTAVLTALSNTFPDYGRYGLQSISQKPSLYVSKESHHSFLKAAKNSGLGTDALREIPVNERYETDTILLSQIIQEDKDNGCKPFMIVANAGTTNAGIIDPINEIAQIAERENIWFHVDAAWGGAAALIPELRDLLKGIHRADSLTFDAHKWLSVPMGAGIYITRHKEILTQTFGMATNYMPKEAAGLDVIDPFNHSIQWSRRFIGLKVFLSLMAAGWDGYAKALRHQKKMGDFLRDALIKNGWEVVNNTPLPIVCFVDNEHEDGRSEIFLSLVSRTIVKSGDAWISTTMLNGNKPVLRACITNYKTTEQDVSFLVQKINSVRENYFR